MFVFSPDDLVNIRGEDSRIVRDNVLFELGLFLGQLGRKRCFILVPEGETDLRMAPDLAGIIPGTYETGRRDGSWQSATGPACNSIREAIIRVGPRSGDAEAPGGAPKQEENTEKAQIKAEAEEQAASSDTAATWAWLDAYFAGNYQLALSLIQERISTSSGDVDPIYLQNWVGRIKYEIDPREGASHFEQQLSQYEKE
jgi:hypothetical protein